MGMLTNPQVATLQRILAISNEVLPKLEMLESLAGINPNLLTRVRELRAQREYLVSLSTAALEIDRQIVPGTTGAGFGAPTSPPPTWLPPDPSAGGIKAAPGGGGGGPSPPAAGTTYIYWSGTIPQDADRALSRYSQGGASFDPGRAQWRTIVRRSDVPAVLAIWPGFVEG